LSVAENILIGREPMKWGFIDRKAMAEEARRILQGLGVDLDIEQTLGACSVAVQQMAAIARALEISSARVLVLDEPTSSLDMSEVDQLFRVIRRLRENGVGIIFISHFLDQVFEIADRITVLRNGKLVGTYHTDALTRMQLIKLMIGRSLAVYDDMSKTKLESGQHIEGDETLLEAKGLGLTGSVEPFDLELHAGEVVGLAGLLGSGRTEIARLLFGIDKPDSGSLTIGDKAIKDYSPLDSIKRGVALCPEDRKAQGIVGELTVRENIILAMQANLGWFKYLSMKRQYEIAERYIEMLNIATPSADQPVKNLSGGNQQKVILARWLATNPRILILDEPTRGIDIGAKAEIQKMVLSLAEEGKSCVFISSELDEVMRTGHRIMVLRDRKKTAEFSGEVDEHTIMHSIGGSD
ncbi:MAG: sugar ABC transporter ATP-binding protein, partial [Anaerolineales bacterium]|nr:sugar ABC transporter ATP-binding protein [Anaerolineales bacterium]